MTDKLDVAEKVRQLIQERRVDEEFLNVLVDIARSVSGTAYQGQQDDPMSLAGDFIVALAEAEISGEIRSLADLRREFRRWTARSSSPQESELWMIVSRALRELEKQGAVERPPEKRKFNNANTIAWYLPQYQGLKGDWSVLDGIANKLPEVKPKGGNDRLLKPDEARACVLVVLGEFKGAMAMQYLVRTLYHALPLLKVNVSMDAKMGDSEEEGLTMHEKLEAGEVYRGNEMMLEEESQGICSRIWKQACALEKGAKKKVSGAKVLCCYFIPKYIAGQQPVLEEFGSSSTVQEVVAALRLIMKENLPVVTKEKDDFALQQGQCVCITRLVLNAIANLCSEKGYCRAFYSDWG